MRICAVIGLLFLVVAPALAAPHMMPAGDALDKKTCQKLVDDLRTRIEFHTNIKFRRHVECGVETRARWNQKLKAGGFGGRMARSGLAYYNLVSNRIMVVPWTIGGYLRPKPIMRTKDEWIASLESILLHELTHALHNQNFYILLGGARQASLKTGGLTEEELDVSTVEFLLSEGLAEFVADRATSPLGRQSLLRHPEREIDGVQTLMRRYKPDGKRPYRVILSATGYQDGLNLLNQLSLKSGARSVRGVVYRPPPRVLFFQPEILGTVNVDAPPNPDDILGVLAPAVLDGGELFLATNPGTGRFFERARTGGSRSRAKGCLVGYYTELDGGRKRYGFFVADPDRPGNWIQDQADSLKELGQLKSKTVPLPLQGGAKARLIVVDGGEGIGRYVWAEAANLVVVAHEEKPTALLERRVLVALSSLYIKRPTPKLYDEALKKAKAKLAG